MVKYFTPLLVIYMLFTVSCGKKDDPVSPKNIERIIIAPEMIIQRKGITFDVAVRYFKDYADHDKVVLTLNGQPGTLQSEASDQLTGTTMVFRFQPVAQAGDFPLKVVIDNSQKVVEQQQVLRFVDDYTLPKVWNSLQKDYLSTIFFREDKDKMGNIQIDGFLYGEPYTNLGNYFLTSRSSIQNAQKPFINGLSGQYTLKFDNGALQEIKVTHGDKSLEMDYSPAATSAEISVAEGTAFVSEENYGSEKVTTYHNQEFNLSLHETSREVYTIVTRVQR